MLVFLHAGRCTSQIRDAGFVVILKEVLCFVCCRYVSTVFPIGAMFAMTLWLGNTAYLYISVAFAQMLKAISKDLQC